MDFAEEASNALHSSLSLSSNPEANLESFVKLRYAHAANYRGKIVDAFR